MAAYRSVNEVGAALLRLDTISDKTEDDIIAAAKVVQKDAEDASPAKLKDTNESGRLKSTYLRPEYEKNLAATRTSVITLSESLLAYTVDMRERMERAETLLNTTLTTPAFDELKTTLSIVKKNNTKLYTHVRSLLPESESDNDEEEAAPAPVVGPLRAAAAAAAPAVEEEIDEAAVKLAQTFLKTVPYKEGIIPSLDMWAVDGGAPRVNAALDLVARAKKAGPTII